MATDFQLNDGQMFIFKNEKCDESKNQRTHQGQLKIDGKEYWVSCWVKSGKNGKFFSCNVQEKDDAPHVTAPNNMNTGDIGDDIPF